MALPEYPKEMPSPFAADGNKNSIPENSATGFSYEQGFPPITQIPPGAGGLAPDRADFNGAFFELSEHAYFTQAGGVYRWSETLDYPLNAQIVGSDNNYYKALQTSGPSTAAGIKNPLNEPTFWSLIDTSGKVELTDSVTTTSSVIAASATAVKTAYDRASTTATTSRAGISQLSNATNSSSQSTAATSLAVKNAYDLAQLALDSGGVALTDSVSTTSSTIAASATAVKTAYTKASTTATTSRAGIVELSNAVNSTSQTEAATSYAVKQAYDAAIAGGVDLTDRVDLTSSVIAASATAVKTAYDKGVTAQNAANSAQDTAVSAQNSANTAKSTADSAATAASTAQATADGKWTAASATTSRQGIVQLSTSFSSTSSSVAATSSAVKYAYDRGTAALTAANTAQSTANAKMSNFYAEDGDGTAVAISNGQYIQFFEGSNIDINFTDTSPGTISDPYELTFSVPNGSTSTRGCVQLSTSTTSSSTTTAATSSAVNAVRALTGQAYVTATWKASDGSSWYIKFSSGLILQGGNQDNLNTTITFPISFSTTTYTTNIGFNMHNNGAQVIDKYTNRIVTSSYTQNTDMRGGWFAAGF